MPVPVPVVPRQVAHPVIKTHPGARVEAEQSVFQNLTHNLPLPPRGPPPSLGTREEWISSLPTWRRQKSRGSWEDASHRLSKDYAERENMRLDTGLMGAGDASFPTGGRALACPPLVFPSLTFAAPTSYERSGEQLEDDADSDYAGMPPYGTGSEWSYSDEDMDADNGFIERGEVRHNASPAYEQDSYSSPLVDDLSPSGALDPASSPGPITPFGEFVDRAVASGPNALQLGTNAGGFGKPQALEYRPYGSKGCGPQCTQCQSDAPYNPERVPAAAPVPASAPTATDSYRKLVDPLSEWLAVFVWKVCTTGMYLPSELVSHRPQMGATSNLPPAHLASSIRSLLLSTLLQPSAILLSLKYIVKLPVFFGHMHLGPEHVEARQFRRELFGDADGLEREAMEAQAPFRLVVLGCMLANKWLDDHTFSNKTWHTISDIPIRWLNRLEFLAISMFRYDLSISPRDWTQWLECIMSYHVGLSSAPSPYPQPISRPSTTPHSIVRRAIDELVHASRSHTSSVDHFSDGITPEPVFIGLEQRKQEKRQKDEPSWGWGHGGADPFDIDLDEDGPLREEYVPKRRSSKTQVTHPPGTSGAGHLHDRADSGRTLPPPAKWSPDADEPIVRGRDRSSSHYVAPQAAAVPVYPQAPYQADVRYQPWAATGYAADKPYMPPAYGYNPAPLSYMRTAYGYPVSTVHSRSQSSGFGSAYGNVRVTPPPSGPEFAWPGTEYRSYPAAYYAQA